MAGSRRIAGITIELGADTSKLTEQLRAVDKQLSSSASSLRDINKLLKLDPGNTTLLVQKQKELQTSIKSTKDRLTELKSVQKESVTPEKWDALQREIIDTEQQLKGLEKEYKSFGSVATQQIKAVGEKMKTIGSNIADVGKTLTTRVTAPIVAGFGVAVKSAADFEAQMSKVAAISGATAEDLEVLSKKAREMGMSTKFSATESGEALEYMAMAGWNTKEMMDGLEGVMYLAAASGEELGTTSDIVTDALTAFGKSAADAGEFADVLAKASSVSNTNVSMMGETFKYVAPLAGALSYDYKDVAVAIGLMANSGIKASQAGTALRSMFTRLSKPTKQSAEAMEKLGISITKPNGQTKPLSELLKDLRTKFAGLSEAEKTQYAAMLAGQNGMSGLLAIVNATDQEFADLTENINNSSGAAKDMADTMNDNLAGQITILKSTLSEIGIQFGEILLPFVKGFVEWIQKLATGFANLSAPVKTVITLVGTIAAAAGPLLLGIGTAIKLGGTALTGLAKIAPALKAVMAVLSGPAGIVVAIGAAVAAIITLTGGWDKLKTAAVNAWNSIKQKVTEAWDKIKPTFDEISEKLEPVKKTFGDLIDTIKGFLEGDQSLGDVGYVIKDLADKFLGFLDEVVPGFKDFHENVLKPLASFVKVTFTTAWDGIKTFFVETLPPVIEDLKTKFSEFHTTVLMPLGTFIKATFTKAWEGLKTFFTETLPEGITTLQTAFSTFHTTVLEPLGTFLSETFIKAWESLQTFFTETLPTVIENAKTAFSDFHTTVLMPLGTFLKTTFIKAWEGLQTFFSETLPPIIEDVKTGFSVFKTEILEPLGTFLTDTFLAAWKDINTFWTETLSPKLNELKTAFDEFKTDVLDPIATFLGDTFTTAWNGIISLFGSKDDSDSVSGKVESLRKTLNTIWNTVLRPLANFVSSTLSLSWDVFKEALSGLLDFITNVFKGDWKGAWEAIVQAFGNIFKKIVDKVKTPINSVIGFLNTLIDKVESAINTIINGINSALTISIPQFGEWINLPDWMGGPKWVGFPGFNWSPNLSPVDWGQIPTLAAGGTVRNGGQAIVGEYAPEYLRVINGQAVVTPMQGGRWNKQGNSTINNNITINQQPGESSEQLAQRVQRVLVRWEKESRAVFGT